MSFSAELEKYIEENVYSNWSVEAWQKAEIEWADFPRDSEEYGKLSLLRKQRERKLSDERVTREHFLNSFNQKVEELEVNRPLGDLLYFNVKEEAAFNRAIEKKYKSFIDTYEELKKEKGFKSDYAVCKASNLTRDSLSRLKNNSKHITERDYLWALSLGMGLDIEETERLFNSCGLTVTGVFNFIEKKERRERALEFFVKHHIGIEQANKELIKHELTPTLGNANH